MFCCKSDTEKWRLGMTITSTVNSEQLHGLESLPEPSKALWWGDGGICSLVACSSATVLGHAELLWGSWWESCFKLAPITNQAPYVFHGSGERSQQLKRENEITNLQLCLRWKISGFWLSNENIVTRLISYVVPERQKSKCVNSLLKADS